MNNLISEKYVRGNRLKYIDRLTLQCMIFFLEIPRFDTLIKEVHGYNSKKPGTLLHLELRKQLT